MVEAAPICLLKLLDQPFRANVRVLDPETDRVELIPPNKVPSKTVGARLVSPGEVFHPGHEGFSPLQWKVCVRPPSTEAPVGGGFHTFDVLLEDASADGLEQRGLRTRIVVHYLHKQNRRSLKHVRSTAGEILQVHAYCGSSPIYPSNPYSIQHSKQQADKPRRI
eukprot:6208600-Pleurochrysis_carterae.AAC.1